MQEKDNVRYDDKIDVTRRKISTSVEITDTPPPSPQPNEIDAESYTSHTGTTRLGKEELVHLFQDRNLAFVSTLARDGSPHVTPVWAEMLGDLILINTFETSAKNKHVSKDKRIALSIVDHNNPFNMVSIQGRVIEQTTEGADDHLKGLAKKYLGLGKYYYRKPNHKRIIIKIHPEKVMGLSIHPAFYFLAYSPWNR
ncbi:MAG: PPOX class F420-dependent oxidoreductase [Nitrososphaeraceae archaeon]